MFVSFFPTKTTRPRVRQDQRAEARNPAIAALGETDKHLGSGHLMVLLDQLGFNGLQHR
jgi:hypothetical protein